MATLSTKLNQRVSHADFGPGTVRAIQDSGARLRVYFDAVGGTEVVAAESCTPLGSPVVVGSTTAKPAQSAGELPGSKPRGVVQDRLAIECLRQGLPPPGRLSDWTVGQVRARRELASILDRAVQGSGEMVFATAPYGQGKTHLGRLAMEIAAEKGLATMEVELDGKGRSLDDGARLVAELFSALRLPRSVFSGANSEPGIGTLLRRVAGSMITRGHLPELAVFFDFLTYPAQWAESDEAVASLEGYLAGTTTRAAAASEMRRVLGRPVDLPSLKMEWGALDQRRRAQGDQLSRIVALARVAGAKGALVVLDELDQDYCGLRHEKKNSMLAELNRIAESGPVVVLLLARELSVQNAKEIPLDKTMADSDLAALVNKVVDTYAAVYPHLAFGRGREELFSGLNRKFGDEYAPRGWGPRFFVRATIEACDAVRTRKLTSFEDVVL